MPETELCWMPASELAVAIKKKNVPPVDAVDAVLNRIDALPHVNAYRLGERERLR